ncbi:DpnII family type II restriction endonuclease [Staphylococcus aureus]|uniref:DpnII family type II restriction endonuclease n=1 Tax=Staphylococcus aureus TaxID=1280 RepID=UPI0021488643|nr:DpnII family type II restriction endonuclease [Staphylococcus aureus]MCR0668903.1 Dam family site-specific DNA-(adenine-N6)-methyltransferase [Staphylococcus aureus]MCR0674442.1 Dam family site-specific DNA-(adenine-N6)-methyltransferase [Staphylococcus aureus]MCR0677533.1 Dam family site-specific DNA-(adenine-N6)-methyltransferase [Staphylococcus aureus]MDD9342134.1 DpnII family type II restriction endonuclease [Staphylococcus aureus]MDD9353921.1 DpnII family type II restriction endonuclea
MSEYKLTPIVKWAGGKTQLLDAINALVPNDFAIYHEPFLGGGATLLSNQPKNAIINDLNHELMTTYNVIKHDITPLIKELKDMIKQHNTNNAKDFYMTVREQEILNLNDIEIAARFLYLNKTGFNGLYRVNSQGKFNVPFNKKDMIKNSTVFSETNLRNLNKYFNENNIIILNEDFNEALKKVKENDFVFIDSPYDEAYTSYQKGGFHEKEHKELAERLIELDKQGVKWIVTNHNTKLIQSLYNQFDFYEIPVNRFINSDAQKRSNATNEVLILNYKPTKRQLKEFERAKFYKQLKPTSFVLKEYVKWEKLQENVREYELQLNDLNVLMASDEFEFKEKFERLYSQRAESFDILPLFISSRNKQIEYWSSDGEAKKYGFDKKETVFDFLVESGLRENLFMNNRYKNVLDYILGLEVGLSSNDKKNYTGTWMMNQIANLLKENDITFRKEVPYKEIIDANRIKDKTFDFVFNKDDVTYCLEVNFFNTSGSKINSEAERFIELNKELQNYEDIEFIWVTDGIGLKKNQTSINKAMKSIGNLYNLTTFDEFLKEL